MGGKWLRVRHTHNRMRGQWGFEKLDRDLGKEMVVGHVFGVVLTSLHAGLMERKVGEMQVMKTVCREGASDVRVPLRGAGTVNCVDLSYFSVLSFFEAGLYLSDVNDETTLRRLL